MVPYCTQEYVTHLAELHRWVCAAPARSERSGNSPPQGGEEEEGDVNAGQEARLPLVLRLVALLAEAGAACPWLLEALAAPEVTARLWTTFDLLGGSAERQGELSWYNRALDTTARCALFRLPPLQGDNAQRKAFLVALVSAAKHPDAEVRLAAARALPAVFAVYPNSLGVWDQYRRQGVLVAPGETEEAGEAALLGSPSITARPSPRPSRSTACSAGWGSCWPWAPRAARPTASRAWRSSPCVAGGRTRRGPPPTRPTPRPRSSSGAEQVGAAAAAAAALARSTCRRRRVCGRGRRARCGRWWRRCWRTWRGGWATRRPAR